MFLIFAQLIRYHLVSGSARFFIIRLKVIRLGTIRPYKLYFVSFRLAFKMKTLAIYLKVFFLGMILILQHVEGNLADEPVQTQRKRLILF